jgi:hypothetical protein
VAKLWLSYREGLRLLGAVVATEVSLESAAARLDIAPWRFFSSQAPESVPLEQARGAMERKRALLEVTATDRYDLCGLVVGFYDSPYSPPECMRRLGTDGAAATPRAAA